MGNKSKQNFKYLVLSFVVGIAALIILNYTEYSPRIITLWKSTSLFSAFYIFPFVYFALFLNEKIYLRKQNSALSALKRIIVIISKSTFNIFLVQMVYYYFVAYKVYDLFGINWISLMINIFVCLFVGIIFYFVERPVTRFAISAIDKRFK